MAASSYYATVQKAYIAFYGRPADPNGLTYWATRIDAAGGNISSIISAFGSSSEATSLYGGLSNASAVNTLYNQIFGRDADVTGLNFYVGKILDGSYTLVDIAQRIIDGASGTDATIVSNKLTAAQSFTDAIDTTSEVISYSGTSAATAARSWLSTVSSSSSSVTSAQGTIDSTLSQMSSNSTGTGSSLSLTSGQDLFTGTTGGDVFSAPAGTYSGGDILDGGQGTDQIKLYLSDSSLSGSNLMPVVSNVEQAFIIGTFSGGGSAAFDLAANFQGMSSLTFNGTFNSALITDADTGVSLIANSGVGGTVLFDRSGGTADAINLKVVNASGFELHISAIDKFSALNLNVTNGWTASRGNADAILLAAPNGGTGAAVGTLNLTGSGSTEFGLTIESAMSAFTFNASAFSGNVYVDLTYGTSVSTSANMTVKLGTGADTLRYNIETALGFTALVADGGAGTDMLILDVLTGAGTVGSAFTNFEDISVVAGGGSVATGLSFANSTANFGTIYAWGSSGLHLLGLKDSATVQFVSAATGNWLLSLNTALASNVTSNALNVKVDNTAANGFSIAFDSADGGTVYVDTVNVSFMTAFSGGSANRWVFGSADVNVLAGTGSVQLGGVHSAGSAVNINATAFQGDLTYVLDYGTTANDVSALFGAGADTFKITLRADLTAYVDGGGGTDTYDVTLYSAAAGSKTLKGTAIETVLIRDVSAIATMTLDVSAFGGADLRILLTSGNTHSGTDLVLNGVGSGDLLVYMGSGAGSAASGIDLTVNASSGNSMLMTLAGNSGVTGDLTVAAVDVNCASDFTLSLANTGKGGVTAVVTTMTAGAASSITINGPGSGDGSLTVGTLSLSTASIDSVTLNAGAGGDLIVTNLIAGGASAITMSVGACAELSVGAVSASTANYSISVAGSATIAAVEMMQLTKVSALATGSGQLDLSLNLVSNSAGLSTGGSGLYLIDLQAQDSASWITLRIESSLVSANSATVTVAGHGSGQFTIDLRSAFTGTEFAGSTTGLVLDFSSAFGAVQVIGAGSGTNVVAYLGLGASTTGSLGTNGLSGNTYGGSTGIDIVFGGSGADYIFGSAGNDSLNGGDGNDIIIGGGGADVMSGGAGSDKYVFELATGAGANGDQTDAGGANASTVSDTIYVTTGDYIFVSGLTTFVDVSAAGLVGTTIGTNSGATLKITTASFNSFGTAFVGSAGGLSIYQESGNTIIEVVQESALAAGALSAGGDYLRIVLNGVTGWTALSAVFTLSSDASGAYLTYKG